MTWLAAIMEFFGKFRKGRGISIIIPFRCPDPTHPRARNVIWLKKYWKAQLPGAEIIMGEDPDLNVPFSKCVAINNGVAKSKGDVLVLIDADGYMAINDLLACVEEIRLARKKGHKLWFVPYRKFYRLTQAASELILASDPQHPVEFPTPPNEDHYYKGEPDKGHWYGAMCQIMPREAFDAVGGWDPRFRGWGGEDHAAMRAMDTLWAPHKTMPSQILHIWHPQIGNNGVQDFVWKDRRWDGQNDSAVNNRLSWRYYWATGKPQIMRKLLDEGFKWYEDHIHEYRERKVQHGEEPLDHHS